MKLSRRTNSIILWIISVALLVGMIVTFTPTGNLFGRTAQQNEVPALLVNGRPISELEVARAEQSSRLYTAVSEGPVAQDLQLLLLDSLVTNEVLQQAAADTRVSNGEVRAAVNEFREQNNVAGSGNDQRYLGLIGNAGFTDATFRDYTREGLRQEKYLDGVTGEVEVTDDEVRAFYDANSDAYTTEARIVARDIVLPSQAQADDVYARLLAGEDFTTLAQAFSTERADQAGALGAAAGSSDPAPVGRAALPTAVADAAFGLGGAGLTEPISAGERFYIVQVENFIPSQPQPFDEVQNQVREDALAAKRAGAQEAVLEALRAEATVTTPEGSATTYSNPAVARVGEEEILAADLNRATYTNPQVQNFLSPDNAQLITQFFKPSILESLINQALAAQGAQALGISPIGPEPTVAQSALSYVGKDASASDADVQAYYDENLSRFTLPPRAVATQVTFDNQAAADAFRQSLTTQGLAEQTGAVTGGAQSGGVSGGVTGGATESPLQAAASAAGGTVQDLGVVTPGGFTPELETALFEGTLTPVPGSVRGVSDVVTTTEEVPAEVPATGGATGGVTGGATGGITGGTQTVPTYTVLLATRTPERVQPLTEVRPQIEQAVLQQKRQELRDTWLSDLRDTYPVTNLLAEVTAGTGGAATGGAVTGGTEPEPAVATTGGAVAGEAVTGGAVTGGAATGGLEIITGAAATGGVTPTPVTGGTGGQ